MNPGNKKKHTAEVVQDSEEVESDEGVDVYRVNEEGGLELIPQEDYDVVYLDQDVEGSWDKKLYEKMADGEAKEGEVQDEDAMEVDDTENNSNAATVDDQMLYIIHKHPQISIQSPTHQDDASSTSDSTTSEPTSFYTANPSNRKISTETAMAQTLTRALVQRTQGFDSIRRNFGLDEEEREEKNRRKKDKQKKVGATSSSGLGVSKDKKDASPLAATDDEDDEEPKQQISKGHKLISSILSTANIQDGDDPETLARLSKMRRWHEEHIDPEMVGINLENWEDQIDWEGGVSSDEEEDKKQAAVPKESYNPETADCTPDFQPAEPEGGNPKRLKRMPQHQLYSDDPIQILYEPRNPRLDALDLCAAVDWEGACSDSDEEYERPNIPLILQSSMAGKSIASLMAPLASSRPLPFEAHPNYQQRYDNEYTSELTAAELQSNIPGGSEALERYKEMRQKKREQMAKDKQSRVTEVMSALSLTGTGRRITSSLMGPGGAEVSFICFHTTITYCINNHSPPTPVFLHTSAPGGQVGMPWGAVPLMMQNMWSSWSLFILIK